MQIIQCVKHDCLTWRLNRGASSERGYVTSKRELGRNSYRMDGIQTVEQRAFQLHRHPNPPLPASGTAIVFSIRFGRLVLSFAPPDLSSSIERTFWQFRVNRAVYIQWNIFDHLFIEHSVGEGWSLLSRRGFLFFFLSIFVDVLKKRIRNWNISNNCFFFRKKKFDKVRNDGKIFRRNSSKQNKIKTRGEL